MSIFEHVTVFVSIILGLAVVHLLGGVSLMLDARVRARVYWVHMAWTANMLFLTVLVWLGSFVLVDVPAFGPWHFLNLLVYSMVIYLMSGLLFPVAGGEVTDFKTHFHANRRRFYLLGLLFVVTDAVDGILELQAADVEFNPFQYGTLAVFATFFLVGIRSPGDRVNGVGALVFFLGLVGFLYSLVQVGVLA